MSGLTINETVAAQLKEMWRKIQHLQPGIGQQTSIRNSLSNRRQIQLTEDLEPATNFSTSPATAVANLLCRNHAGNLVPHKINGTQLTIVIVNRFEHLETIPAFTYGAAIRQDGEWQLDALDCDAAASGLLT